MDQPHSHRALPRRGGDSLDRATAHVASGEYSWHARLQRVWLARKSPPGVFLERGAVQRLPSQDEAAFVEFDNSFEPAGVGLRTDEDEDGSRPEGSTRARAVVLDHDPFQVILSREFSDHSVGKQLDVLGVRNPIYEIP